MSALKVTDFFLFDKYILLEPGIVLQAHLQLMRQRLDRRWSDRIIRGRRRVGAIDAVLKNLNLLLKSFILSLKLDII